MLDTIHIHFIHLTQVIPLEAPPIHQDEDGMVRITGDHWGIPTPTLDALKNRSIPPDEAHHDGWHDVLLVVVFLL